MDIAKRLYLHIGMMLGSLKSVTYVPGLYIREWEGVRVNHPPTHSPLTLALSPKGRGNSPAPFRRGGPKNFPRVDTSRNEVVNNLGDFGSDYAIDLSDRRSILKDSTLVPERFNKGVDYRQFVEEHIPNRSEINGVAVCTFE
jgi:hypothetical protein